MSPLPPHVATYLSVTAAAAAVGVTRRTIYNWLYAGRLDTVRTAGGRLRINPASLLRAAASREGEAA